MHGADKPLPLYSKRNTIAGSTLSARRASESSTRTHGYRQLSQLNKRRPRQSAPGNRKFTRESNEELARMIETRRARHHAGL